MNKIYEYNKLLEPLKENENNIYKIVNYLLQEKRNEPDYSYNFITYALSFCDSNNLTLSGGWFHYCFGWLYFDMIKTKDSIKEFLDAISMFLKCSDPKALANAYNGLSVAVCDTNNYELVCQLVIKGVVQSLLINDYDLLCKLCVNFSISLLNIGKYDFCKNIIDFLEKDFDYSNTSFRNKLFYEKTYSYIEIYTGNFEKATMHANNLYNMLNHPEAEAFIGEIYKIKAICYSKNKDYENAEKYFKLSYDISYNNNINDTCACLASWAEHKVDYNRYDEFLDINLEIIKYAQNNNIRSYVRRSYFDLYEYYQGVHDYEKALDYLEKYNYLNIINEDPDYKQIIAKINIDMFNSNYNFEELLTNKTELLSDLIHKIMSTLNLNELFEILDNNIDNLIDTNAIILSTYDKNTNIVEYKKSNNYKIETVKCDLDEMDGTLLHYCIKNNTSIIIGDLSKEHKKYASKNNYYKYKHDRSKSLIFIPLSFNNETNGVLSVQSYKHYVYTQKDIEILKILGNFLSVAIKNVTQYKSMVNLAQFDSLTGFYNKSNILKIGKNFIDSYRKTSKPFYILMIDINHFRMINNKYGHVTGDIILHSIASIITKNIGTNDFAGRFGGDEFLVFCDSTSFAEINLIINNIKSEIYTKDFSYSDKNFLTASVSIGMFKYDNPILTLTEAINFADEDLYKDKDAN